MKDPVTHQTLLKGDNEEGIYKLMTSPTLLAFIGERISPTKWHDRLGHPHFGILLTILNKYGLPTTHKTVQYVCDACSLAKSHKLPFSQSTYKSTRPLALIHSDVWGLAPITSRFSYSYYVIFVDDYSKYTWLFPMKKKSDVFFPYFVISMSKLNVNFPLSCSHFNQTREENIKLSPLILKIMV